MENNARNNSSSNALISFDMSDRNQMSTNPFEMPDAGVNSTSTTTTTNKLNDIETNLIVSTVGKAEESIQKGFQILFFL